MKPSRKIASQQQRIPATSMRAATGSLTILPVVLVVLFCLGFDVLNTRSNSVEGPTVNASHRQAGKATTASGTLPEFDATPQTPLDTIDTAPVTTPLDTTSDASVTVSSTPAANTQQPSTTTPASAPASAMHATTSGPVPATVQKPAASNAKPLTMQQILTQTIANLKK